MWMNIGILLLFFLFYSLNYIHFFIHNNHLNFLCLL
ncbi:hypothetical protein DI000_15615 [Legionella pneumophila]|nr:hypothetical protein DI000_15615 [Legionella pneumophila]